MNSAPQAAGFTAKIKSKSPKNKNQSLEEPKLPELSEADKRKVFISLLQSGLTPQEALEAAGLKATANTDSMLEVRLEELLLARTLNPKAKVYFDDDLRLLPDNFTRTPGELTILEIRDLVDFLYFYKGFPLLQIAKTLHLPIKLIADTKKDLSESNWAAIKNFSPETYISDFITRTQQLTSIALNDLKHAPVGSKERVLFLRFIQLADEKVINKLQEIGYIEKHLGSMQVNEEWTIRVSNSGPPTQSHRKFNDDEDSGGKVIDVTPEKSLEDKRNLLPELYLEPEANKQTLTDKPDCLDKSKISTPPEVSPDINQIKKRAEELLTKEDSAFNFISIKEPSNSGPSQEAQEQDFVKIPNSEPKKETSLIIKRN